MVQWRPADALAKAQVRAKSDVANKLVAMLLGEISQQQDWANQVRQKAYIDIVAVTFQGACPYCGKALDPGTLQLEHLDAMNQYRAGLHVSGNVVPACRDCNLAKRQFDRDGNLPRGLSGWEAFMLHEPQPTCGETCKVCRRWKVAWPGLSPEASREKRHVHLSRIRAFRRETMPQEAAAVSKAMAVELARFYKKGQKWAEAETERFIQRLLEVSREGSVALPE